MTTSTSATSSAVSTPAERDVDAASQWPVAVQSCSRLGRTANPPRRFLGNWFRFLRRR